METMTSYAEAKIIVRRIAVTDMIRGVALILLTLGCVVVWFHRDFRLAEVPLQWSLKVTKHIAEAGVAGLAVVAGLTLFFYRRYRLRWAQYYMVVISLVLIGLYKWIFSPLLLGIPWVVVGLGSTALVLAGVALGWLLRDRMLLDADEYALYMRRMHDFRKVLLVFGQAPLFFFLSMWFVTCLLAWITALLSGFDWHGIDFLRGYEGLPAAFGYSLPRIYLLGFCMVGLLYPLCKWYIRWKKSILRS